MSSRKPLSRPSTLFARPVRLFTPSASLAPIASAASIALLATALGLFAPACAHDPAPPSRLIYVAIPPPPDPVEVSGSAPSPRYVWVTGRYDWNGVEYVWIPGQWEPRPHERAVWVSGRWMRTRYGWVWVEGHWS
ncbi:hypothetical protein [Pendulispora albinea]|uniref:YXWGXW repeat-containing protein n=1 Tax=Pendulispora albinea TaxID=2741071 RepID=A0ABZ2LPV1_9BACT